MMGEYWIDKSNNGGKNSFFQMLEGLQLNEEEKQIVAFMNEAQFRYENIILPPKSRLNVHSMEKYLPKASNTVLEALTKCCVLTGVFVPIRDITVGKYKDLLSYSQRFSMWKGSGFKGVAAYGHEFIKESLLDRDLQVENLFELHTQMNVKGFLVKNFSDVIESPSLLNKIVPSSAIKKVFVLSTELTL